jgi:hypothetical protein
MTCNDAERRMGALGVVLAQVAVAQPGGIMTNTTTPVFLFGEPWRARAASYSALHEVVNACLTDAACFFFRR